MNPDTTSKSKNKNTAISNRLKASPKKEPVKSVKTLNNGTVRSKTTVTPDERHHMIAVAAYCRAERRGFIGGDAVEDWLAAESEIEKFLANRLLGF